jgi:uncharacterized protein YdcH (DUF465 family)
MDQQTLELIATARMAYPELDTIVNEHQDLDDEVNKLSLLAHLSDQESVELNRMKKEKLRLRDKIQQIIHQKESA